MGTWQKWGYMSDRSDVIQERGESTAAGLRRGALGNLDLTAATLANLAPVAGLFTSITLIGAAMGTRAPWAFVIGAVAIAATANTLSEFSKVIPSAGSFVTFISRSHGRYSKAAGSYLATTTYYTLLISYPLAITAIVIFLGFWLTVVLTLAASAWVPIAIGVLVVTTPLLLRGVTRSTRAALLMFAVEAVGLIVLSIALLALSSGHLNAPLQSVGGSPGGFAGLSGITFALAVSGFIGWENSGPLAEEAKNPRKAIPRTIFTGIAVVSLIYFLATWAASAGFLAWKGPQGGAQAFGNVTSAAPFLDLSNHFTPWWSWMVGLIGVTSALGCYIAAAVSNTRITYNGAHEGLLPPLMARVTRARAPVGAVAIYVSIAAALIIIPYFVVSTSAVIVYSDLISIATVPILLVYLLANISLPIYMYRRDGHAFSVVRHLLLPLIGSAVLVYGIYQFVQPNQPSPDNVFWVFVLIILVVAGAAAAITLRIRPGAVDRVGTALAHDAAPLPGEALHRT
jgi:amino acid transporter